MQTAFFAREMTAFSARGDADQKISVASPRLGDFSMSFHDKRKNVFPATDFARKNECAVWNNADSPTNQLFSGSRNNSGTRHTKRAFALPPSIDSPPVRCCNRHGSTRHEGA
jgi:hypothetical protein